MISELSSKPLESPETQMHVVGHEDERPSREFEVDACRSNGGGQPFAGAILGQKWIRAEATESPFVGMATLLDRTAVSSLHDHHGK